MSIRVFVGCAANEDDIESQAVLEYTLRKHASQPIALTWMKLSRDPKSFWFSSGKQGWRTDTWATPFSGFRWAVPAYCNFKGRAIYMDSDVIVRADIAELWTQKLEPGKVVLAKGGKESWRYCVSLWDCAAAKPHIPPIEQLRSNPGAHRAMVERFRNNQKLVEAFSGNWNCIDLEDYKDIEDPDIKIIHYSSEAHQPQLKFAIPRLRAKGRSHWFDGQVKPHWRPELSVLFLNLLKGAEASGYPVGRYMTGEIFGEYVKASQANYRSHQWAR